MLHAGDGFGFGAESCQVRAVDVTASQNHLKRHQALELAVPRLVNHAHAAPAKFHKKLVTWNGQE